MRIWEHSAYICIIVIAAVRAQGVLKLLRSLLERFPSSSSVRAAITALTAIAADTVVHVPDQVYFYLFCKFVKKKKPF